MKIYNKIKTISLALGFSAYALTSCMNGGYDEMGSVTTQSTYGCDTITEHHVVTLNQLYNMPNYASTFGQQRSYQEVTDDIQLKLRVTGNDQGGNIYNKVAMQDDNGDAIIVTVYSGGMYAYLPIGQEVLINLKGLYVGNYGYQHQIGVPYTTSSGNTYAGRMPNWMWQEHFRLIGTPDASKVQPIEFTNEVKNNIDKYSGRLMTIKNVSVDGVNRNLTWAEASKSVQEDEENTEFSTERYLKGIDKNIVVYTSTSAKFASDKIPTGKMNITGIFSRYGTTWQILIRTIDDVQSIN